MMTLTFKSNPKSEGVGGMDTVVDVHHFPYVRRSNPLGGARVSLPGFRRPYVFIRNKTTIPLRTITLHPLGDVRSDVRCVSSDACPENTFAAA